MSAVVDVVTAAYEQDPDAAQAFIDDVITEYVAELATDEGFLADVAGAARQVVDTARAALGREYVSKAIEGEYPSDDFDQYARWLAGLSSYVAQASHGDITKAFGWEDWFRGGRQRRVQVARDDQGRFARIVDTNRTSSVSGTAPERVSDAVRARPELYDQDRLTDEGRGQADTLDRHQAQWEQANDAVKDLHRMLRGETKGVRVVLTRDKAGNSAAPLSFDLADARTGIPASVALALNPVDEEIKSVSIEYDDSASDAARARIARFNSFGILNDGTAGFASTLDRNDGSRSAFDRTFGAQLGDNIQRPGSDVFYERARGASEVLRAVGADKPAKFAHLVGTLGPEADAVLGPHVRRAAYRYRGTEKSPDRDLLQEFGSQDMRMVTAIADGEVPNEQVRAIREAAGAPGSGVVASSLATRARSASGDQLALQVRSDVAAAHLVRSLPTDPRTAKLSERAGDVLPSQGVLINADGEVVAQAVGYADDHYLPFNLANLAQLRGGQYARTRVAGGPTGEDLYASIKGGARMATVVSGSGVYSIEFDPNFRGGRAMSDRAQSMYQRYLKILDAVDQSGMYLKDVGPEVHDRADRAGREAARYLPAGSGDAKATYERVRDQVLADAREAERYGYDAEELKTQAEQTARQDPQWGRLNAARQAALVADVFDELKTEAQSAGVQELTLNAAGYELALKTLQQQFPYFIRNVSYEPLAQGRTGADGAGFLERVQAPSQLRAVASARLQRAGRRDSGYVSPGGLRPNTTRSGFYDTGNVNALPKQRSEAPGGSAAAPAATGTTAPAASSSGSASNAAPPSTGQAQAAAAPLMRRLAPYQQAAQKQADAAVLGVAGALQSVTREAVPEGEMSWEDVRATDNTISMAKQLLSNVPDLRARLSDPTARAVLSDPKAVTAAFQSVYGPRVNNDTLAGSDSLSETFGGATSDKEAAAFVADSLRTAAAQMDLLQPFGEATNDPFYTGQAPQAFADLAALDSGDKLRAFLNTGDGQRIGAIEQQLSSLGPVDQVASSLAERLQAVAQASAQVAQDTAIQRGDVTGMQARYADAVARSAGLQSTEQLTAVLGAPPSAATLSPDAITRRGLDLQRARTLSRVRDVLSLIEGSGGEPPFVPAPPSGAVWQGGKSLWLPPEVAGLPVLDLEHPATVRAILASAGIS